jgi:hypothetical protein
MDLYKKDRGGLAAAGYAAWDNEKELRNREVGQTTI